MKYKVGDIVRIRNNLSPYNDYGGLEWTCSMDRYLGKIATVTEVHKDYYSLDIDKEGNGYTDEMLEPCEKAKTNMEQFIDEIVGSLYVLSVKYFEKEKSILNHFGGTKIIMFDPNRYDEEKIKEYLLEEYKPKIKLTKMEFDLIDSNDMSHHHRFDKFKTYQHMVDRGYFKGVYDKKMTLEEILNNCEIVE